MKTVNLIKTQSGAANVTSSAYQLGDQQTFSCEVVFSGGGGNLAGTLTLQASNDETGASNFITVSGSSQAVTSSASHMWNVTGAGYRWVRVFWNYTSGTGNITANLTVKDNLVRAG